MTGQRMLTGDRPTGKLHLGHYVGSIANRVRLQSAIPEICELNTLFQNLVTVPRLERIPSLKDMARDAQKDEMPYGLLGYPVLQAADILCVKAHAVPVDVEVKDKLAKAINRFLDPMRERRAIYESQSGLVDEIIVEGTERTRREVQQVTLEVRKAMGLAGTYMQFRRKVERVRKKREAAGT